MLTRRALLVSAAVVAVTSCAPRPTIVGGPTAPPEVPPLPELPGAASARTHEATLLALAQRLPENVPARDDLARTHERHLTALRHPDPELRPTGTPSPQPGFTPPPADLPEVTLPGDRDHAVRTVRDRLGEAAHSHADAAVDADGTTALLWASMHAACLAEQVALDTGPRAPLVDDAPALLPDLSPAGVLRAALDQCHAVIHVMQTALGTLGGSDARSLEDALSRRRRLRAVLSDELLGMNEDPPAAHAAYDVPALDGDANAARTLVADTDARFTRFLGPWIAVTETSRRAAVEALADVHRSAVGWGAPLVVWPGWPVAD